MSMLRDLCKAIPSANLVGWETRGKKYNSIIDEHQALYGGHKNNSFPTRKTLEDLDLATWRMMERLGKLG